MKCKVSKNNRQNIVFFLKKITKITTDIKLD